ncbi:MAG: DUF5615 family PIN-like protein [Nitrospirota bacterium]
MRVLLDECVPRKLKKNLERRDVHTVPEMGWAGKKNGELLRLAAERFDVLLTVDRSLIYQHDLPSVSITVISLDARSNRLADLLPLMPQVRSRLLHIQPGQMIRVGS